jgi:IS4 transposase
MRKPPIGTIGPCWAVTRPDGVVWRRTFATEGAAWRVVIPGMVSPAAFRLRRAEMVRKGWIVRVASNDAGKSEIISRTGRA